jgi:predicted nucleic acid-binding protein
VKTCLIDTGPFVAYLNAKDAAHKSTTESLKRFRGELATTSAVITEVMYFVSDHPNGAFAFAQFLTGTRVRIVESTQAVQILAAAEMMNRYADTPMDFADATLVLLAEDIGVIDIFTLDRRGFSTYRTSRGKAFRLQ